jgi:hypothetical protein
MDYLELEVEAHSLGLGEHSIMVHAHPPQGTFRSRQPIIPCSDGAFPTVQLPLLGEELPPPPPPAAHQPLSMLPPHLEEEKTYTNQQAGISTTTRGKLRQPSAQSKTPPGQQ